MDTPGPADSHFGHALREYAAAGFSGVLRADGRPGGTVYFADGQISACATPGAPGLEVILLRSGRISESDWNAAFLAAAVGGRPMTADLVESGLLGAGEAEALLRTALADAVFAILSGPVDDWTEAPAEDCLLPLVPPARCGWLLGEAARRAQVLASFPQPALTARDRIAAAPTPPDRVPAPGQDEILVLADGRRTPRDLAFGLGRGLYETMLHLARMRAANLVEVSPSSRTAASAPVTAVTPAEKEAEPAGGLPRRRRDRPGAPRLGETSLRNIAANIGLLRPRAEGSTTPGGAR
ncbi:MAG TPA: hypothetical protein VGD91_12395 [Trebonia sp.]